MKGWLVALAVTQAISASVELAHFVTVPANPMQPPRAWEAAAWRTHVISLAACP